MQSKTEKTGVIDQIKQNPSLLLVVVASFFVMGLGQVLNRQRLKGLLFFIIPVAFLAWEFSTSQWGNMDEGYKTDYQQYYGSLFAGYGGKAGSTEKMGETLTQLLNRKDADGNLIPVLVGTPFTDVVDASAVAADEEAEQISIRSDLTSSATTHGFVMPAYMAKSLVAPLETIDSTALDDAALAKIGTLTSAFAEVAFQTIRDNSSVSPTQGLSQVSYTADKVSDLPAGKLIRIKYPINVEDSDMGLLTEYFSLDFASTVIGPTPKEGEVLHPIRDYGGYVTRSLWGMVTLGKVVTNQEYRGIKMQASDPDRAWAWADSSSQLLARGLIVSLLLAFLVIFWVLNIIDAWKNRLVILSGKKTQNIVEYFKGLWEHAYVWILIAPTILLMGFFIVIPFVYSFLVSMTNWTYQIRMMVDLIEWRGLNEYFVVFGEPAWLEVFFSVFGWTVLWAILSSITVYAMGFAHALVVENPLVKGRRIWRTIMIMPWAMPAMISLLAFRNIFDKEGFINHLLYQVDANGQVVVNLSEPLSNFFYSIGLQEKPETIIQWFTSPGNTNLAKAVALMVNLWLGAPYFMMLITGVMTTIPADRYEAATIDGANAFQRFRYITFPLVINATIPAMIMTVTFNFNNFGAMYFLTQGKPDWVLEKLPESLRVWSLSMPGTTDILISWVYKIASGGDSALYNKAGVFVLFIFVILSLFSVINMRITKAFNEEGEE